MKPSFESMWSAYPRREQVTRDVLFDQLGWQDLKNNGTYHNTCAIRMSVALAGARVPIPGRLFIKQGALKGRGVEPGQANLSWILRKQWGAPEVYHSEAEARKRIGVRRGVISFFSIDGSPQGHIDLVRPDGYGFQECAMSCYFGSREYWFWPLN